MNSLGEIGHRLKKSDRIRGAGVFSYIMALPNTACKKIYFWKIPIKLEALPIFKYEQYHNK